MNEHLPALLPLQPKRPTGKASKMIFWEIKHLEISFRIHLFPMKKPGSTELAPTPFKTMHFNFSRLIIFR